jgi:hypothetical protein
LYRWDLPITETIIVESGDLRLVWKVDSIVRLRPATDFISPLLASSTIDCPANIDGAQGFCGNCHGQTRCPLRNNDRRNDARLGLRGFCLAVAGVTIDVAVVAAEAGSSCEGLSGLPFDELLALSVHPAMTCDRVRHL